MRAAVRRSEYDYLVRFDEADAHGHLRASGYLRFAQDVAWRQSQTAGFDRGWYRDRSLQWLVRDVSVSIDRPIEPGEVILVSTEVVGWRHVWARRRSEFVASATTGAPGQRSRRAVVVTDWVLLTTDGKPAKVPDELAVAFGPRQPFERDRLELPARSGPLATLRTWVRPSDVDPMGHMNNAAYLDVVDDGLAHMPTASQPVTSERYRIGFVASARPGMTLEAGCWHSGDGAIACRVSDAGGRELARALVGGRGR